MSYKEDRRMIVNSINYIDLDGRSLDEAIKFLTDMKESILPDKEYVEVFLLKDYSGDFYLNGKRYETEKEWYNRVNWKEIEEKSIEEKEREELKRLMSKYLL